MKLLVNSIFVAVTTFLQVAIAQPVSDPKVDFTGSWDNHRGSIMKIQQDSKGILTGTYTTYVGGPGGKPFTRDIVGQSNGDQLVLHVDWSPYSMTAWVGQLLSNHSGNEVLDTIWVSTVNVTPQDEPDYGWGSVRNGGDSFERVPGADKPEASN